MCDFVGGSTGYFVWGIEALDNEGDEPFGRGHLGDL